MRLLMPKPFRDNKITIYKNFTLIDFFVFLGVLFVAVLIVVFLPIIPLLKVLIAIPLSVPAFILVLKNRKNNCRNYELIIRWFKFKSYIRSFRKRAIIDEVKDDSVVNVFDSGIVFSDSRVMIDINDDVNWLHLRFRDVDFLKVIDVMYSDHVNVINLFDEIENEQNIVYAADESQNHEFIDDSQMMNLDFLENVEHMEDHNEFI